MEIETQKRHRGKRHGMMKSETEVTQLQNKEPLGPPEMEEAWKDSSLELSEDPRPC